MAKNGKAIKVKSFSELSAEQKGSIAVWLYEIYRAFYIDTELLPAETEQHEEIIKRFAMKIKENRIDIPDKQIRLYYNSKQNSMIKRLKKEFPDMLCEKYYTVD
ncbi:MAG: hypothetical protein K2J32_08205 [Ruminococcus sp.]|nr:hypothetical protein [Ruminococcus sp.]